MNLTLKRNGIYLPKRIVPSAEVPKIHQKNVAHVKTKHEGKYPEPIVSFSEPLDADDKKSSEVDSEIADKFFLENWKKNPKFSYSCRSLDLDPDFLGNQLGSKDIKVDNVLGTDNMDPFIDGRGILSAIGMSTWSLLKSDEPIRELRNDVKVRPRLPLTHFL